MFRSFSKILCGAAICLTASVFAESYDLPLILVETHGQTLDSLEKKNVTIRLLDNGTNLVSDSALGILLNAGMKIRGQTSATFPKKGYGIEIWDEQGQSVDTSFLGLPASDDWILHGPYVDKSLIRNALAHYLYQKTGRYSPRTRFAELILNGEYKGIYLVEEKIKRGKARIDIAKLKETDVSGDDLTGGYIWSIDKVNNNSTIGLDAEGFKSNGGSPIVMRYPKKENLAQEQLAYIQNFVNSIESTCTNGNMGESGCAGIVDFDAAVDYMMHQEITKNTDAFICSFYMFKDKDSKGGKMQMGAPWDFNLAFGAVSYSSGMDSTGWQIEVNAQAMSMGDYFVTAWEKNIWNDANFREKFQDRWAELRSSVWHTQNIHHFIDSLKTLLSNAATRNFERWPNLGKPSGMYDADPLSSNTGENLSWGGFGGWGGFNFGMTMNGYSEPTWNAEVEHLRNYVMARIRWIDSQENFTEPPEPIAKESIPTGKRHPRKFSTPSRIGNTVTVQSATEGRFKLFDLNGKEKKSILRYRFQPE